jgi:hypothetical protein
MGSNTHINRGTAAEHDGVEGFRVVPHLFDGVEGFRVVLYMFKILHTTRAEALLHSWVITERRPLQMPSRFGLIRWKNSHTSFGLIMALLLLIFFGFGTLTLWLHLCLKFWLQCLPGLSFTDLVLTLIKMARG